MSKRRKFTPQFKARVALAVLSGVHSHAEICKQYHLPSGQFSQWRTDLEANARCFRHQLLQDQRRALNESLTPAS